LYTEKVSNWLAADIARRNTEGWTPAKIAARAAGIADWCVEV
jgi:hypothetical protein